jgi:energy-coupling factor transport system ATP-binding protein
MRGVRYAYPRQRGADRSDVLVGVDLDAEAPHSLCVLGPNLSGKTTLATLIVKHHLDQVDGRLGGSLTICPDGTVPNAVGVLFEDVHWMLCNIYVDEEVAFGLENLGVPASEMRQRVAVALSAAGLAGFERRVINTLSGGELQKVAIIAVLITSPAILVTDDVLSNLDVPSSLALPQMIGEHVASAGTLWIDFARRWSPYVTSHGSIARLERGRTAASASPTAIVSRWDSGNGSEVEIPVAAEIALEANRQLIASGQPQIPVTCDRVITVTHLAARFRVVEARSAAESIPSDTDLSMEDLAFSYSVERPILRGCRVGFVRGRVNILAGRNGAGKTTLAKLCAGLMGRHTGRILWQRAKASPSLLRRKVALVFQNPEYQFLADTVADEIALACRLARSADRRLDDAAADRVLAVVGLEEKRELSPYRLTAGEKRRLAVGIALVRDAEAIFVDEPTLGQDRANTVALGELFRELARNGKTVVLISHDSRFVYEFGDAIHLLENGSITYSGGVVGAFVAETSHDFAGQSEVLEVWRRLGGDGGSGGGGQVPRTVEALMNRLQIRDDVA